MTKLLNVDDVLEVHARLVEMFASGPDPIVPPGAKDVGLVESATHRPLTSLGGTEKYSSIHAKASALFHSLVKNHAFHNGNKRTALVSLLVFLELNDFRVSATDDELFDFVIAATTDKLLSNSRQSSDEAVSAIESWLREHTSRSNARPRVMKTQHFLDAVRQAGGTYRKSGPSWLVTGPTSQSIKISLSTNQLDGPVVKKHLRNIGLSEGQTGIHLDEFQDGLDPNQRLMRQFRTVLARLAHA